MVDEREEDVSERDSKRALRRSEIAEQTPGREDVTKSEGQS